MTNHYRRRIPYRLWRRSHYVNFVVWAAATVHGLGSGTDRTAPWLIALYAASAGTVVTLVLWRTLRAGDACSWPERCRGRSRGSLPGASRREAASAAVDRARFHDRLTGQILTQQGVSQAVVSMAGTGRGAQDVLVRADLLAGRGRLESTSLQLEYLPSGVVCAGRIAHVASLGFSGTCRTSNGARREVEATWRLVNENHLRGSIAARPGPRPG